MAGFTKVLTNKWTPNVGRSSSDANSLANVNIREAENGWDSGRSKELRVSFLGRIQTPFPLICGSLDNPIDVQIVDVVEEAQLKGIIAMEAGTSTPAPRRRFGNNPSSTSSPDLNRQRPCKLSLSIHGVKISDPALVNSKSEVVHLRQPLHSILSAVSFQGQKETFIIALAVTLEPVSTFSGYGGGGGGNSGTLPSSSSSASDVIFASCLVFQANSSEEAATFVKDLKDIFVVAMRSKSPP